MVAPKTSPRSPADYSRYLATAEPLLIVGGQAVNLWALYYPDATTGLEPFVSRDVDILGDRQTLREIAALAGLKPCYFPMKPPSNEIGYVMPKDSADMPMLIEVLRWVHGASAEELSEQAVTFAIGEKKIPIRVPSPVILLKAKLANLARINQQGRQDEKHVQILFQVIPRYLTDYAALVQEEQRSERDFLSILDELLEIVTDEPAQKVLAQVGLAAKKLFADLPTEAMPKIAAFKKHQLTRRLH